METDQGGTSVVDTDEEEADLPSITPELALILASWARMLYDHFKTPQDVEWCVDMEGNPCLLQNRPLNKPVPGSSRANVERPGIKAHPIFKGGETASTGTASGRVFNLVEQPDWSRLTRGSILVAPAGGAELAVLMDRISGIITEYGGKASHLASVAREFGIPYMAGAQGATKILSHGMEISMDAEGLCVYEGIVADFTRPKSPSFPFDDTPFYTKFTSVMKFVSPLRLTDPASPDFRPEGCRSLHDIIRFVHEKAVSTMFDISGKGGGKGAKRLDSHLPISVFIVDVGGGVDNVGRDKASITPENISSIPLKWVWRGLTHPSVKWGEMHHFNWSDYDSIVLSGGVISKNSPNLATYAVVSSDYLNLNMRFGYHFAILDTLCSPFDQTNHIMLRFAGGGGDFEGRSARARYIKGILHRLGMNVTVTADLIEAQVKGISCDKVKEVLREIGRLLGVTRLMDMSLSGDEDIERMVQEFFKSGRE